MEPNSQPNPLPDLHALTDQIREIYGRVVYSHKTQEKCADILNNQHRLIKTWQLILSAFTTTSVLSRVFTGYDWTLAAAAILSTIQFGFNAYLKEYDLGKVAQRHAESANDLLGIREAYFTLLTDIQSKLIRVEDVVAKRDQLEQDLLNIYKSAPRSFPSAYRAASKALKEMEEMTFSDAEIDKFLPNILRKCKN
ncbi:SLATT domain-containing protein [Spirosoma sp. HMF4905]|uniref:SLATT domain-containing protein n=1 Tax=Spirosoma arboris TaxID=2682092 RepID=A0A7K1SI14_9BACT|nr:SLATT domain-containing protein [Spirosoma arboris]MVM33403.1 SLATT domain-containing protein [Spirosoma arboris]